MTWTDGSKYIGQWFKGIQHGYGKIIFPDGTFKEGYFDNNAYIGHLPSKSMLLNQKYHTPMKNGKIGGYNQKSHTDQK